MPQSSNGMQAVGRRREAVARVRLMPGKAQIIVNGKPIAEIFKGLVSQKQYMKPFELTKTWGEYTGTVKIVGGGTASQLDAFVHGVARALSKASAEYRSTLKRNGLLTRDPRARERRKPGQKGRARAKPQSPKR